MVYTNWMLLNKMKENRDPKVSVVIGIFRSITTACYVFKKNPENISTLQKPVYFKVGL